MSSRLPALVVLVTAVLLVAAACSSDDETVTEKLRGSPPPPESAPASVVGTVAKILGFEATPTPTTTTPTSGNGGVAFTVNLQDPGGGHVYQFDPSQMTFSVGDTVTFVLTADTEFHTFTVDDLAIDQAVDAGEAVRLTFTFDQAGTFPLICIPHELNGMVGTITVN